MTTRLTILCENSAGVPFGVIGEHGFSCFIETAEGNYLFDTGQGFGIIRNSLALNKDLKNIKAIMVSHGHYDHTGGLPAVLQLKGETEIFAHPDIFSDRTWVTGGRAHFVGIPYRRSYLESLGARFHLRSDFSQVGPAIFLSGEIPRRNAFEKGDPNMTALLQDGGIIHPDPLKDDLSLIIDTEKGLVLVLGCAHAGMINIIEHALEKTGRDRIFAIIGGTHLGFSSDEQFEETLRVMDTYKIEHLGVSHCTGLPKAAMLHARLGKKFFFGTVGSSLQV
jgi:7,8-dihydropterin-6-yl-methyl-4-(beta-D-ribofuranosyl)aminobenzene 5'-phosphate synthase